MATLTIQRFAGIAPRIPADDPRRPFAQVAHDIDLTAGHPAPLRTDKQISEDTGHYLWTDGCCTYVGEHCEMIAERDLPCKLYFRSGHANGYLEVTEDLCNPDWVRFGMPCNLRAPTANYLGNTETDGKRIERRYLYTFVDKWGNEGGGSIPSDPVLLDWDVPATITDFRIPADYPGIERIRIYSTQPGVTGESAGELPQIQFFEVGEISIEEAIFFHTPDEVVPGRGYSLEGQSAPPAGIRDVQIMGTQIVGLAGDSMFMSLPNEYHAWDEAYELRFKDKPITWKAAQGFAYILTDGRPAVVDLKVDCAGGKCHNVLTFDDPLPLAARRSVARFRDSVIYASTKGLVMIQRNQANLLSRDLFTRDQWLELLAHGGFHGEVHDGYYYFRSSGSQTYRLKLPGNLFDALPENALTTLSIKPQAMHEADNGRLYFTAADGVYEFEGGDTYRTWQWQSRIISLPNEPNLAGILLDQSCRECVQVSLVRHDCEGRPPISRQICDQRVHTLPNYLRSSSFSLDMSGQTEVTQAKLSTSLSELRGSG